MGNKMNLQKLVFSFIILGFLLIVGIIPPFLSNSKTVYLNEEISLTNIDIISYYSIENHTSTCYLNMSEPTLFLRLDDVRAYSVPSPFVIDEALRRNLSITLGVIPEGLDKDYKIKRIHI